MPLLERGWHEHINKLTEQEAFIDSVRVKNAELKDKFLFVILGALCVSVVSLLTLGKYNRISCRGHAWFCITWLCIAVKIKCSLVFEISHELKIIKISSASFYVLGLRRRFSSLCNTTLSSGSSRSRQYQPPFTAFAIRNPCLIRFKKEVTKKDFFPPFLHYCYYSGALFVEGKNVLVTLLKSQVWSPSRTAWLFRVQEVRDEE